MNPAAYAAKKKNARQVLNYIIKNGETSRVELAGALELSAGTVTNIVTELMEQNLLYESRRTQSPAGRKTTLLQFNANLFYVVSVEITASRSRQSVNLAICNLLGETLTERSVSCDMFVTPERSDSAVLKDLIALIQGFVQQQPQEVLSRIYGVGVCVGGMVIANRTVDMPILNWKNMNLVMPLQAVLRLPVYAEGITRIKALYETRFIDPSERNILYLNLSTGVGMVNFFNGKMVMGKNGIAGEVGHISLNPNGPPCFCGNRGCFEYYCGMHNILDRAAELLVEENRDDVFYDLVVNQKEPLTAGLLFRAREMGSLVVHELLCEVSEYLGAGIATLYNIYDPDRLILSGYLSGADSFLLESARAIAGSRIINRFSREINLSMAHITGENIHLTTSAFVLTKFLDSLY